jgi:hypothetical protein
LSVGLTAPLRSADHETDSHGGSIISGAVFNFTNCIIGAGAMGLRCRDTLHRVVSSRSGNNNNLLGQKAIMLKRNPQDAIESFVLELESCTRTEAVTDETCTRFAEQCKDCDVCE